jgi:hypothetical protein
VFKRSPSIPKTRAYKKMVECPAAVPVALNTLERRTCGRADRPCHVRVEHILGMGMGEADANDDEGLEIVEEGQVCPPWPTGNIPNWPQEPTPRQAHQLVWHGSAFEGPI